MPDNVVIHMLKSRLVWPKIKEVGRNNPPRAQAKRTAAEKRKARLIALQRMKRHFGPAWRYEVVLNGVRRAPESRLLARRRIASQAHHSWIMQSGRGPI